MQNLTSIIIVGEWESPTFCTKAMGKIVAKKLGAPSARVGKETASSGTSKRIGPANSVVVIKTSNSDSKGRVVLGPQYANKMFRMSEQPDGNLLLEPVVTVHEREVWFYKNPEVQAMVQEGIRQSRSGKGKYLGSFAQYANLEIDDED